MSGTGVYEAADRSIRNMVGGNGDCKGVQIVKSRCVESWLHRCTGEFNAVLSQCGVKRTAHGFFDSKPDLALEVLSMTVEDVALEQSFATCLPLPQKRHRFWSKWCWRSCWVSLPSFLRFERLEFGFFWLELPELAFLVVFGVLELPELFLLLLSFLFLSTFGVVLLFTLVPLPLLLEHSGFRVVGVSLATSEWHSQ